MKVMARMCVGRQTNLWKSENNKGHIKEGNGRCVEGIKKKGVQLYGRVPHHARNACAEKATALNDEHAAASRRSNITSTFMEDVMAKTAREKLLDDFHAVISDTEDLMKSVSNESGGKSQDLRDRIEGNLKQAREYLHDFEGAVVDKSKVAAQKTDEYVHENAWRTIGIAVGIGILIGLLMRGRD
jgi:ElaB/YqjD/DUF883 family membrane-anchored ribosome-binding protein